MFADADADLDLAADLLANGKTSRLYRRLVFDERIATDVSASQNSREIGGFLQVAATAAPGHALGEIERVMLDEIARLAAEGPTGEEIERGRIQAESQFMFRLQTVGGFGGKSDQLNAYNVFVGDPAYFERDLARYQAATGASLKQAVATYLQPARRVTLSVVPRGRTELAAPDSTPAERVMRQRLKPPAADASRGPQRGSRVGVAVASLLLVRSGPHPRPLLSRAFALDSGRWR